MDKEIRCFNQLWSDIILKDVTARKANAYVRKTCSEYYMVPPGFEFRGVAIQLKSPMLAGIVAGEQKILMPFKKPCYGTMLYEINAEEGDFTYIRSALGGKHAKGKRTGIPERKKVT